MDKVISCLNTLIDTSKDGEEGFRTCAENVVDPQLKTLLMAASQRCASGAHELQEEVRRLGGEPETGGTVSGSVMRAWINIKGAVSGKDDGAILAECERGEDYAVKAYKDALKEELPQSTRQIVEEQYRGVIENHDKIRGLRDHYKAA